MKRTKSNKESITIVNKSEGSSIPANNSKCNNKRIKEAYRLALFGLTDYDIAKEMGVSIPTLTYWKNNKDGFYEALKAGKIAADTKVVNALYQNAIGFEYDDIIVNNNKIREFNEFGVVIREYYKTEITPIKKKVLPDTKAQIKWLQARQPEKWGDNRSIKVKNQLNISIQNNMIDFSEISDSELELIKKLGLMQGNNNMLTSGEDVDYEELD